MAVFYDTHAHLGFADFAADLPLVIERAQEAGIAKIICIGTDLESSARAVQIAGEYPQVYAAAGWHPTHALNAPADIRPALRELGRHPKVVAIGEMGLDYHRRPGAAVTEADYERYKRRQGDLFRQQLEVAAELGLNCIIHQRDSFEDTLAELTPFAGRTRGVFHCFSESIEAMGRVLALGCLVSFTGIVTFKSGGSVRQALAAAAPGQFMFETDSPYLAPMPHRGKRCEPAYVREIAELAATLKHCSLDQLSAVTCETAHRFFPKLKE